MRSISANGSPAHRHTNDRAGGHASTWSDAYSHGQSYTPKQVACHDFYQGKARLSWSQDYGRPVHHGRGTSSPTSPVSPPSRPASPPPRIVELEGSPPIVSPARFGPRPMMQQPPRPTWKMRHAQCAPTIELGNGNGNGNGTSIDPPGSKTPTAGSDVMVIPRKPVGSGLSRTPSPKKPSHPHYISMYDRPADVGRGKQTRARPVDTIEGGIKTNRKRNSAAWETSEDAFHPEELLACSPGASRTLGSPGKTSIDRKARPKPTVRFRSESEASSEDGRDERRMFGDNSALWTRKRNAQANKPTQVGAASSV